MNDKTKSLYPPDGEWVQYPLSIVEGRCIPEKRLRLIDGEWTIEYRYPAPDEEPVNADVIKALDCCSANPTDCGICPYHGYQDPNGDDYPDCREKLLIDVMTLLKKQSVNLKISGFLK